MDIAIAKLVVFALVMNSYEGVLAKGPEEVEFHFRSINKYKSLDPLKEALPSPVSEALSNYLNVWGPVSEPAPEPSSTAILHIATDPATEPNSIKEIKEKIDVSHQDNK